MNQHHNPTDPVQTATPPATLTDDIMAQIVAPSGPIQAFPLTAAEAYQMRRTLKIIGAFVLAVVLAIALNIAVHAGGGRDGLFGDMMGGSHFGRGGF